MGSVFCKEGVKLKKSAESKKQFKKEKRMLKKHPLSYYLSGVAVTALFVYAFGVFVSTQSKITKQKNELQKIKEQIELVEQQNGEYARILNTEDEDEYMFRMAVEKLGYAYPNETRFYPRIK